MIADEENVLYAYAPHFPHFWVMPTGMPKVVSHCGMNILCLPQFTFQTAFVGS